MLLSVEEKVLRNNPNFALLYRTLTTTVLNPDGTTKDDADADAQDSAAVRKDLEKYRLKLAKHHLLERALATATLDPKPAATAKCPRASLRNRRNHPGPASGNLPEPLLDLLLLLPPFLGAANSLPPDSIALLLSSPPLSNLKSLLPDLADLVSSNLHDSALSLARLIYPAINPSYLHRHVSSLPQDYAKLNFTLSSSEEVLFAARLRTLFSLTDLLQMYSECITCLVRSLEAKHGVVARSLELHASDVSLQAQCGEKLVEQMMWKLRKEIYSPEVVPALRSYMAHLQDAKVRGAERIRGLTAELDAYGVGFGVENDGGEGKEKTMREISRAYREMGKQMDGVKHDLERLQVSR